MNVIQKDINGNKLNMFPSVSMASKKLNIKRDIILKCCQGKQKTVKGYIFSYGI